MTEKETVAGGGEVELSLVFRDIFEKDAESVVEDLRPFAERHSKHLRVKIGSDPAQRTRAEIHVSCSLDRLHRIASSIVKDARGSDVNRGLELLARALSVYAVAWIPPSSSRPPARASSYPSMPPLHP